MNGGNRLKADEEIDKIQKRLDELLEKVGLNQTEKFVNPLSKKSLELTHEVMRQMGKEDLYEAAIMLKQYAIKITIDINRYNVLIDWCKNLLNDELASTLNKDELIRTYNYDLLVSSIAVENDYVSKVHNLLKYYRAYKQQLDNISWAITQQANTIENFARGKQYG